MRYEGGGGGVEVKVGDVVVRDRYVRLKSSFWGGGEEMEGRTQHIHNRSTHASGWATKNEAFFFEGRPSCLAAWAQALPKSMNAWVRGSPPSRFLWGVASLPSYRPLLDWQHTLVLTHS